jgi:hypothetical protein
MMKMKCIGAPGAVLLSVTAFAGVSDVVKHSGVKGGIIVHLDCNDGKDTAKLRINNNNLSVQGLDTRRPERSRARRRSDETNRVIHL